MTHPQKRSKSWGYQVEMAALKCLREVFPRMRRTGSPAYSKAAADLVQEGRDGGPPIVRLVVTRDKRRPLLVTLSMEDFLELVPPVPDGDVVVQVKGRQRTWIGALYDALKAAT